MCVESCLKCWLSARDCDGTSLSVRRWVMERGADPRSVLPYLEDNGGFCGCEVLLNVFDGRRIVLDDLVLCCA